MLDRATHARVATCRPRTDVFLPLKQRSELSINQKCACFDGFLLAMLLCALILHEYG